MAWCGVVCCVCVLCVCVAVCCNVFQCVAVCCSVFQCVACSVLLCKYASVQLNVVVAVVVAVGGMEWNGVEWSVMA